MLATWSEYLSQWFVAIGTIAVVVVAIWGDWFRSHIAGPRLKIEPQNFRGTLTNKDNDACAIYYHLRVSNSRHWSPARSCRVMLRRVERRGPDGRFHPIQLPVPLQYIWSPAGFTQVLPTIKKDQTLDFGYLPKSFPQCRFIPCFYTTTVNFDGYVNPNESIRYHLEIVADNFVSSHLQVFEVSWNGKWSENMDEMANSLRICEVFVT